MAPDISEATAAAQELLESRLGAIRALAERRASVDRAEAALEQARVQDQDAYDAARKAGWTDAELRKIGFTQLGARAGARRRRKSAPASATRPPAAVSQNSQPTTE